MVSFISSFVKKIVAVYVHNREVLFLSVKWNKALNYAKSGRITYLRKANTYIPSSSWFSGSEYEYSMSYWTKLISIVCSLYKHLNSVWRGSKPQTRTCRSMNLNGFETTTDRPRQARRNHWIKCSGVLICTVDVLSRQERSFI